MVYGYGLASLSCCIYVQILKGIDIYFHNSVNFELQLFKLEVGKLNSSLYCFKSNQTTKTSRVYCILCDIYCDANNWLLFE